MLTGNEQKTKKLKTKPYHIFKNQQRYLSNCLLLFFVIKLITVLLFPPIFYMYMINLLSIFFAVNSLPLSSRCRLGHKF